MAISFLWQAWSLDSLFVAGFGSIVRDPAAGRASFWDDAEHLRSRRARKRRLRTDRSDSGQTVTVDTAAGPATVTLPDGITGEDRLRVVQAILDLGSVNG